METVSGLLLGLVRRPFISAMAVLFSACLTPQFTAAQVFGAPTQILPMQHNLVPNEWDQHGGDRFGEALAAFGNRIAVAAPKGGSGVVEVHDRSGTLLKLLRTVPTVSGQSVAFVNQDIVAVGAGQVGTGQVLLYDLTNCGYPAASQECSPIAEVVNPQAVPADNFGHIVAAANDLLLVSAGGVDSPSVVYLFTIERDGTQLQATLQHFFRRPTPHTGDTFGESLALDETRVFIGEPAYDREIMRTTGEGQQETVTLAAAGVVFVFDRTQCTAPGNLSSPCPYSSVITKPGAKAGDLFGSSLAADNGRVIIGARLDEPYVPFCTEGSCTYFNPGGNSGAAYLFNTDGSLLRTFVDPAPLFVGNFGWSVALAGDRAMIGKAGEIRVYVYDIADTAQCPASVAPGPGEPEEKALSIRCSPAFALTVPENIVWSNYAYFGAYTLAQANGSLIVGARYDDTLSTNVGAVYVFSPITGANSPPVLDHIGHKTLPSCRLFAFTATATDPDSPAQSLTFSISGAPPLAQIDPVSGRFTWDPYPQQGGEGGATFTFDVVVSDTDLADRETVTLTVPECDEDGDGLLDIWEIFGVDANGDGIIDLDLPALGADPRRKDIFVEVDYLERTGLDAEAIIQALDLVKQAFARAPVENPASWWNGINLHVHISDAISLRRPGYFRDTNPDLFSHSAGDTYFKDNTPSNYGDGDYSTTILGLYELRRMLANRDLDAAADENSYWREQALKKIQHYALLVDKFHGENYESDEEKNFIQYDYSASSGLGEPYGNDFAVAVGNLTNTSDAFLASVFMHELGHNLGLDHGGPIPPDRATILAPALDKDNCKPNYLSVMNYTFNFPIIVADRPLDYSRSQMDLLDENNLDESKGVSISTPPGLWTAYGISPSQDPRLIETGRWVDWNDNNPITATHGTVDSNINAFSMGGNRCSNTEKTLLEGYDDWQNLKLNFRDALYYGIGGGAVGGPVLALTSQRRLPKGIKPIPFSEELTRKEIEHMISNSRTGRIRPIDLTATAVSGEHINLRWKKGKLSEPQVAGYKIMRKLSKQRRWETIVPITGSKATAYADRNLEPKTAYDYTISALTIGGVTSFPSVPATATTHEAGLSRFAVLVAAVIAVVLIFAGIAISRKRSPA